MDEVKEEEARREHASCGECSRHESSELAYLEV
jgi:hypothetical protein